MAGGALRCLVSACVLATALAALFATPALAAYLHPTVTESFGTDGTAASTFENPVELSYNQTGKRLYVLDAVFGSAKIYGFDTTAGTHSPVGGNFPVAVANASSGSFNQLATDNTTRDSAGNFYYVTSEYAPRGGGFGFDSSGNPLGLGFPIRQSSSPGLFGVAVDGAGHVWIVDMVNHALEGYSSSGTTTRETISTSAGDTRQAAFDRSNGNLFVSGYTGVIEYTAASGYTEHIEIENGQGVGGITVDSSSHTLYVAHSFPYDITAYNASGAELETFATSLNGMEDVAVDEATGTVYAGGNGHVNVIPGVVVPDAITGEQTAEATLNGHVDPAGGGAVTSCEFEYGTETSYGDTIPCSPAPPYTNPTDVSADLSGLVTPETTYHYRLVATNANGTNYGPDRSFTPHLVRGLHSDAATSVGKEMATLNAHLIGGGEDTHYYFEWGTTTAYGNQSATPPGATIVAPTGDTPLSFDATGLDPGTTYHYRVVASNGQGTSQGEDRTFTTLKAVADLETEQATALSGTAATLHGSYTGESLDTSCDFEWGTSAKYGNSTPIVDQGSGAGPQAISAQLGELKELTSYHYRVVCHNDSFGDAYGQDELLTTLALPAIAINPVSEYTSPDASEPAAGVTVSGTINPRRGGNPTYHFEYGTTTAYGVSTAETPLGGGGETVTPVSSKLADLDPGTTYHYRLVATSTAGVKQSPDQTFTTVPLPPVVGATSVTDVSATTATLNATVRPGFGATVVFFDYGPTADYGDATPFSAPTAADESDHQLSAQIGGLSPDTTYHYRAVAVNFNSVAQGPDRTFTTAKEFLPGGGSDGGSNPSPAPAPPPAPPAPAPNKEKCRKNFVKRHGRCVRRKPRRHHKHRHHPKPAKGGGRNG